MPPDINERLAVLEARQSRTETDVTELFKFFRDHMEKEEQMNDQFLALIADINQKLNSQKSFWAGMLFAFTGIASFISAVVTYFKTGGS